MKGLSPEFRLASDPVPFASPRRKPPRHKTTRDCPRVTLRLSVEDHARLQELADGMALSTYIRAKALGETLGRRKPHSTASVADKQALAQLLGLLGQSRVANNLNQLAYQANTGSLPIDDAMRDQISEAYEHVVLMRAILIKALGLKA